MKNYSGISKLICILVLAPILIWKLGPGETYTLYKEKQRLEALNQSTPVTNKGFASQSPVTSSEPLISNGKLLQLFADSLAAEQVEVVSYTPEMIDSEDDYKLYCGKLLLSGGYINLVKSISLIEKANLPLKIASISFECDTKKRDTPKGISLYLLIEQVEH